MAENKFIGQVREFNRYAEGTIKEALKLDLIDRKILYLLSENARLSNTFLAKKLKIKRETVAYRIKRMMENDFLHGFFTLLDPKKLGFRNYIVYFKLKNLTKEKEFMDSLFNFKEITRLANCSGSYDLHVVFSIKNSEEFVKIFEEIVNRFHDVIQHYDFFEVLEEDFLGLNVILDKEEARKLDLSERKGSAFLKEIKESSLILEQPDLDDKDKFILEILKLNSKISIKELSSQVAIAPVAVENRIKKMIKTGVIKRFYPLASLSKLGYQWWMVFLKVKNLDKSRFFTFLKYHSNVLWYIKLLGKWDYHFSIFAKDNAEFHKIIDDIRTEFSENIISYDSVIIFNQFKYVQRVE